MRKKTNSENGEPFSTRARKGSVGGASHTPAPQGIRRDVAELLEKNDVGNHCDVNVSMSGKWCTFEGRINSQEMRTALFGLVPTDDGKRYIIDRLQVTYAFEGGEAR